jgi:hypothetical protein
MPMASSNSPRCSATEAMLHLQVNSGAREPAPMKVKLFECTLERSCATIASALHDRHELTGQVNFAGVLQELIAAAGDEQTVVRIYVRACRRPRVCLTRTSYNLRTLLVDAHHQ